MGTCLMLTFVASRHVALRCVASGDTRLRARPQHLQEEPPVAGSFAVFAWVIVRSPRTGRYLLTLEPRGLGGQFWFPAGRVDAGESLEEVGR